MNQVRVRMYCPGGIGDCFLLSFPKGDGMAHVLIDCGVLRGTENGKQRMQEIVNDIARTTDRHLDVLVATHEHWDHVSGFVQAAAEFAQFEKIDEVWLAWTEKEGDPQADRLRAHKFKATQALHAACRRLAEQPATSAAAEALARLNQFSGDLKLEGADSTAAAMKWVRTGTGVTPRWLEPDGKPLHLPGVAGVRAFVLGPPRDEDLLKRSDPSAADSEVFELARGAYGGFAAALSSEDACRQASQPFDRELYTHHANNATKKGFFAHVYQSGPDWRKIDLDWLSTAEVIALQLDADTNNTSLALAFELTASGQVLLFPGDAQVGNWLSWEKVPWAAKDRHGEPITTAGLLHRTVLYKVGHHGSHNATLRQKGLDQMTDPRLVAMIPVDSQQAAHQGKYHWLMPYPKLLASLEEKAGGRVLRTDLGVPATAPADFLAHCHQTDYYIDYLIDM